MAGEFVSIEYASVADLSRVLGVIPIEVKAALKPGLAKAANLVADQARINASYSSRIPGAIYVKPSFSASGGGFVVGANARIAPEAKVLEVGHGRGSTFRHPVFGNDWWVTQNTQPFLFPAVTSKGAEASAAVAADVRAVAARHGLV